MRNLVIGVFIGYIFHDHIDQARRSVAIGMERANDKNEGSPTEA